MDAGGIKEPVGDAVIGLLDVQAPKEELEKGIPLVSFACKEGEGDAVLIRVLPLPEGDAWLEGKEITAGEVLYRVDYLLEGKPGYVTGILPKRDGSGTFLDRLEDAVKRGDAKAGSRPVCELLKLHLTLCGLEDLAGQEISLIAQGENSGGSESYRRAYAAYYKEVLSFAKRGREALNGFPFAEAVLRMPAFPDKGGFMSKWYRKYGMAGRREKKDED